MLEVKLDGAMPAMERTPAVAALEAATQRIACLLYTSDAADERSSVDLGGRRIIKKKRNQKKCSRG